MHMRVAMVCIYISKAPFRKGGVTGVGGGSGMRKENQQRPITACNAREELEQVIVPRARNDAVVVRASRRE